MSYENWEMIWRKQTAPIATLTDEQLVLSVKEDSAEFDREVRSADWRMAAFGLGHAALCVFLLMMSRSHVTGIAWKFSPLLMLSLGLLGFAVVGWWKRRRINQSKADSVRGEIERTIALCRFRARFTRIVFWTCVPLLCALFGWLFSSGEQPIPLRALGALAVVVLAWDGWSIQQRLEKKLDDRLRKYLAVRARFTVSGGVDEAQA